MIKAIVLRSIDQKDSTISDHLALFQKNQMKSQFRVKIRVKSSKNLNSQFQRQKKWVKNLLVK